VEKEVLFLEKQLLRSWFVTVRFARVFPQIKEDEENRRYKGISFAGALLLSF
jgi:hypothetical protein